MCSWHAVRQETHLLGGVLGYLLMPSCAQKIVHFPMQLSDYAESLQTINLTRRPTVVEGLYSGLGSGAALSSTQLDVKMKLLVEAPAAVEDALASLLDHHDATLQVGGCVRQACKPQ